MTLNLYPAFDWRDRDHGFSLPWWVWVEDSDSERIYHHEYVVLQASALGPHLCRFATWRHPHPPLPPTEKAS